MTFFFHIRTSIDLNVENLGSSKRYIGKNLEKSSPYMTNEELLNVDLNVENLGSSKRYIGKNLEKSSPYMTNEEHFSLFCGFFEHVRFPFTKSPAWLVLSGAY